MNHVLHISDMHISISMMLVGNIKNLDVNNLREYLQLDFNYSQLKLIIYDTYS